MIIADIEQFFERWAPAWTAWERDNVGLQVGDRSRRVKKILVALDVTEQIIREAVAKNAELIVSHHPLLFRPASSVTAADEVGRLVLQLAEKKIALFSAHTNLDFTRDGVSFALAKQLGLTAINFLSPLSSSLVKIAVFVPHAHVDRVAEAMTSAGAGTIGHYTACSFRIPGTGTFRGSEETSPFIGRAGTLETAEEIRLEMLAPRARTHSVIKAIKSVHPYEEVAYDVYPLENLNPNFGMGAVGELRQPMALQSFLQTVKRKLNADGLRYTGKRTMRIKRVAVCGGSGSDLVHEAIAAGADALLTADVRYHTFHSASGRIALIDAGHWETEHVILKPIADRLEDFARQARASLKVFITEYSTNPIHFY